MPDSNSEERINNLTEVLERISNKRFFKIIESPSKFMLYNFLGGLARGFGFAIGASIIFALLVWLLSRLSFVPVLGNWISAILDYIQKTRGF